MTGGRLRRTIATVGEWLAARERAREPLVVIEVGGKKDVGPTISKMEAKGYVLVATETKGAGSVLLRFRAGA